MNKPPEIVSTLVYDFWKKYYRGATVGEKQMCEDMKRPMTQKTENLTTQEAWAAMARGECVDTEQAVHRINGLRLEYWRGEKLGWTLTSIIDEGPYSIVPDPSKPKEVEDEYNDSRLAIINLDTVGDGLAEALLTHMDRFFVRKQ